MHSKDPPRNRLAKVLPEVWRKQLIAAGVPKRKYTAVLRITLADGSVVDDAIVEQGWIIAVGRAGLAGVFEQRIAFDPRHISGRRTGPIRLNTHPSFRPLPTWAAVPAGAVVVGGYGVAFATTWGAPAILVALPALVLLGRLPTARRAFYGGLVVGLAAYVPHLWFFGAVFHAAAVPVWLIAALPIAVFVLSLNALHRRWGPTAAMALTPVLWTGIEYFRSELYALRFAWLLPGQAAAFVPGVSLLRLGVYGVGFLYATAAALAVGRRGPVRFAGAAVLVGLAVLMFWRQGRYSTNGPPHVAGVQLELPSVAEATAAIDRLAVAHPEADILVVSEYTFLGPVPPAVRDVVRRRHRHLVAGAERLLDDGRYYDVAVVVGPDGNDAFEQAKSVPVQFMSDGLPAESRRVWQSPWGPIGLAVCYDLGYASVMDDFVRQGARALIVPTMDLTSWGAYERRYLHGRMAPVRSAEYGIATFGVWSSGESQLTDNQGRVIATAPYPGQGAVIAGQLDMDHVGRIPPDRWLAKGATAATAVIFVCLVWPKRRAAPSPP